MSQAHPLDRGELPYADGDEDCAAEPVARRHHHRRQQAELLQFPLQTGGERAETAPRSQIARSKDRACHERTITGFLRAIHPREEQQYRRRARQHHRRHHHPPHGKHQTRVPQGPCRRLHHHVRHARHSRPAGHAHGAHARACTERNPNPGDCDDDDERGNQDQAISPQHCLEDGRITNGHRRVFRHRHRPVRRAPCRLPRISDDARTRSARSGATKLLLVLVVGMDQTVLVPSDMRQRAVTPVQIEFDSSQALGKAGCILGLVEHPAFGQH